MAFGMWYNRQLELARLLLYSQLVAAALCSANPLAEPLKLGVLPPWAPDVVGPAAAGFGTLKNWKVRVVSAP